jgi:hypothetical protein
MIKKPTKSTKKKLSKIKFVVSKLKHTAFRIKEKIKKGEKQVKHKATAILNAARINFNTTKTLHNKAKSFAAKNNLSIQAVMNNALKDYLVKAAVSKNTQKDRGCSIPGFPIGVDQEVGDDYSFGKFEKTYVIEGNCLARL